MIEVYANLDGIPMRHKTKQTEMNEASAKLTLENQKYMEKAGLKPMPCFHFGEPMKYLDYYVKHYDYIALGVAGNSGATLIPWLNICFSEHICDQDGMPKIKVHGFAVTSLKIMMMYPWYSVDSTSWVVTGRMGSIFIPRWKDDRWRYDLNPWKFAVSSRSPGKSDAGKHISTLPKEERDILLRYIHEKGYKLGKSEFKKVKQDHLLLENERWNEKKPTDKSALREVEIMVEIGISNKYQLRDEMNIIYFLDLEKNSKPWPWAFKMKVQNGLF